VTYFENLETATAPAQEVVITDQLDGAKMDFDTFSLGPISFGNTNLEPLPGLAEYATTLDLRPEKELLLKIEARLDKATGIVTWRFTSLDPATGQLPDDPFVGFLPPSVNPPEGEGSVMFTVMPKAGLAIGTVIKNKASIVFDVNAPVETNEWINTVGDVAPAAPTMFKAVSVSANKVNLLWRDNSVGEEGFQIWRRTNLGPWELIATVGPNIRKYKDTTATGNATTTSYRYFIRAFNNFGSTDTNVAVVPFRPRRLRATAVSPTQVDLTWEDASDNEKRFWVYREPGPCSSVAGLERIATKRANSTSHSDTGVTTGTTYTYRVRSYFRSPGKPYARGYSLRSNCAEATTP
jgi:hypothetical protein